MPEEPGQIRANVEAPKGKLAGRVDDKGRLKFPAAVKEYVGRLPNRKVYITSLDGVTVRIYPMETWQQNENFFEDFDDDPQAAQDVAFHLSDVGGDAEMDSEGRVLIPQDLRKSLNLENQHVYLMYFRGAIDVYTQAVYEERKARAEASYAEKLTSLQRKGLK